MEKKKRHPFWNKENMWHIIIIALICYALGALAGVYQWMINGWC